MLVVDVGDHCSVPMHTLGCVQMIGLLILCKKKRVRNTSVSSFYCCCLILLHVDYLFGCPMHLLLYQLLQQDWTWEAQNKVARWIASGGKNARQYG